MKSPESKPVVLLERPADGVALIRINRPDARNALIEKRKPKFQGK